MNTEKIAQQVVSATLDVFETMLGLEIHAGEPKVLPAPPSNSPGIFAFVGLAGSWVGTGSISCSGQLACEFSSSFLMTEFTAVNDEVLDAVAEVTNMIVGNVKTALEEDLGPMGLSIPTVIYGRNFTSRTPPSGNWIVVPFQYGQEELQVNIHIAPNRDAGTPHHAMAGMAGLV